MDDDFGLSDGEASDEEGLWLHRRASTLPYWLGKSVVDGPPDDLGRDDDDPSDTRDVSERGMSPEREESYAESVEGSQCSLEESLTLKHTTALNVIVL